MRDAAHRLTLTAAGQGEALAGTVRVTASDVLSFFHLPGMIRDIRTREPAIQIELVPSDTTSNLLFREADIAIRMYRPTQLDLVTRHIGTLPLTAFAARTYVEHRGVPTGAEDLMRHDFVGYDSNDAIIAWDARRRPAGGAGLVRCTL